MIAGFSRGLITPPRQTLLLGWTCRDCAAEAAGVHDDLYVRALYARHGNQEAIILAFDVIFFSREHAERLKAAVGRVLDLSPRQILINASHTHCGPSVCPYGHRYPIVPDWAYLEEVERQTRTAALTAKAQARPVTIRAGAASTSLPVSRRLPDGNGGVLWAPYREGPVCGHLPLCLLRDEAGRPVCLLFSASCHPSTWYGWEVSADYPGVACDRLDDYLGIATAMFLQGVGGDTKASVIADGGDDANPAWRQGSWEDVVAAGRQLAGDVIAGLDAGLTEVTPAVRTALFEQEYPLQALPDRKVFEGALQSESLLRRLWAQRQLERLERGLSLPTSAALLLQCIKLGEGLRLVAIEGEPVGELGLQILARYASGITFPLGYSNGMGLYLPTSRMLQEGGYEVESYYEYGYPAPLAAGIEGVLDTGIVTMQQRGID